MTLTFLTNPPAKNFDTVPSSQKPTIISFYLEIHLESSGLHLCDIYVSYRHFCISTIIKKENSSATTHEGPWLAVSNSALLTTHLVMLAQVRIKWEE